MIFTILIVVFAISVLINIKCYLFNKKIKIILKSGTKVIDEKDSKDILLIINGKVKKYVEGEQYKKRFKDIYLNKNKNYDVLVIKGNTIIGSTSINVSYDQICLIDVHLPANLE